MAIARFVFVISNMKWLNLICDQCNSIKEVIQYIEWQLPITHPEIISLLITCSMLLFKPFQKLIDLSTVQLRKQLKCFQKWILLKHCNFGMRVLISRNVSIGALEFNYIVLLFTSYLIFLVKHSEVSIHGLWVILKKKNISLNVVYI